MTARDIPRDPPRDPSRDYTPRDSANGATFYHSQSQSLNGLGTASDVVRSLGSGYTSGMISPPRLLNGMSASLQSIGGMTAGENWNTKGVTQATNGRTTAAHAPPQASSQVQSLQQSLILNQQHRASPPRVPPFSSPSPSTTFSDRERDVLRDSLYASRHLQQQQQPPTSISPSAQPALAQPNSLPSPTSTSSPRSTLWWGELEPWMDEEYAKQVCTLMGWEPANIKVPRPAPDPLTGRQANNPGYCFLTFPSQAQAAAVLGQINNGGANGTNVTMPNSSRPFTLNWASSVPAAPLSATSYSGPTISIPGAQNPQYPKEYSIFVGDLAPEVSNSDLVAVFRNPVLGLRNDREPRFIRPFASCKSAKIMLDPVTGVSRGYGFVRFTDEADQQRALIEMHGLYCLSRPMRISPATAKFKSAPGMSGVDFSSLGYGGVLPGVTPPPAEQQVTIALPMPNTSQTKSVSTPLASNGSLLSTSPAGNASGTSVSSQTLSSNPSSTSSATLASVQSDDPNAHSNGNGVSAAAANSISNSLAQPTADQLMAQRFNIPEESWKHHAQARAILSNLIGPNGEQLTSSDPYNTTVFVGGLSPLISEDTLRTFFAPFGEIHYVKVPVGKHCGFVQFVRKPDAERAIEKMQGFPIGGSRIRLSWGRSQYKAAQAAAQAAQVAAYQSQTPYPLATPNQPPALTPEQAVQLLEKFGFGNLLNPALQNNSNTNNIDPSSISAADRDAAAELLNDFNFQPSAFDARTNSLFNASAFSPFSPDPNYLADSLKQANAHATNIQSEVVPTAASLAYSTKAYAPWYTSSGQEEKLASVSGKVSPTSVQAPRPPSGQRFGPFLGENTQDSPFQANRASSRQEAPIARPDLSRRASQVLGSQENFGAPQAQKPAQDHLEDLNGTLASLDLEHNQGSWKSGDAIRAAPASVSP
ncbi:hypothetical protein C8Q75DRAFT_709843 [Abortiporus biennis]|nr:hypothetical protein C8Q75DRAFT_709843 [Abortiporus biennis]